MTSTPSKNLLTDYFLLFVLATLWGSSYAFIKVGVATIPPLTLMAARTVIAASLLLVLMRLQGVRFPSGTRYWRLFAFQALVNSVLPFTLIAWAEQTIDAGVATIINAAPPIFTFLITWLVTRHEAATPRKLLGVLAGLAGIVLMIGVDALRGFNQAVWAQSAIVIATLCYAVAAVFGRHFKGLPPIVPAAGSLISGAVVLVPLSLLFDRPWTLTPSSESLVALGLLSVFCTALAFIIFFRLLGTLGSVGTTSQAYLRVPIGVLIGVLWLAERPSSTAYFGSALVVIGVALMVFAHKAEQPAVRRAA